MLDEQGDSLTLCLSRRQRSGERILMSNFRKEVITCALVRVFSATGAATGVEHDGTVGGACRPRHAHCNKLPTTAAKKPSANCFFKSYLSLEYKCWVWYLFYGVLQFRCSFSVILALIVLDDVSMKFIEIETDMCNYLVKKLFEQCFNLRINLYLYILF